MTSDDAYEKELEQLTWGRMIDWELSKRRARHRIPKDKCKHRKWIAWMPPDRTDLHCRYCGLSLERWKRQEDMYLAVRRALREEA